MRIALRLVAAPSRTAQAASGLGTPCLTISGAQRAASGTPAPSMPSSAAAIRTNADTACGARPPRNPTSRAAPSLLPGGAAPRMACTASPATHPRTRASLSPPYAGTAGISGSPSTAPSAKRARLAASSALLAAGTSRSTSPLLARTYSPIARQLWDPSPVPAYAERRRPSPAARLAAPRNRSSAIPILSAEPSPARICAAARVPESSRPAASSHPAWEDSPASEPSTSESTMSSRSSPPILPPARSSSSACMWLRTLPRPRSLPYRS